MCRAAGIAFVYSLILISCGCDPRAVKPPAIGLPGGLEPARSAPSETPQAIGGLEKVEPMPLVVSKKPDEYRTKEEVEIWLRQDLKLAQVNLTPEPEHGFAGTGLGFNGRNYTLTVKQVPGGIKCWFRDDFGGSGDMAFGKMAEPPKQFVPK